MIWTQNASKSAGTTLAAYSCPNGHVIDPTLTRQCPACGIHDTVLLSDKDGQQEFRCAQCGELFRFPR